MKKAGLLILLVLMAGFMLNNLLMKNKQLQIGDQVPDFTLKDQDGNDFSSASFVGDQPMVIYFYPKDDTPGCTKEACSFRDAYEQFTDLNVKVVGISSDAIASHKKFAEKYQLPYTLLSDTENSVRKAFGVPKSLLGLLPGRVTYVIDNKGKIIYIFNSQFKSEKHIEEALRILKK